MSVQCQIFQQVYTDLHYLYSILQREGKKYVNVKCQMKHLSELNCKD